MADVGERSTTSSENTPAHSRVVNIRMDSETRSLIDRAAHSLGKNRSEFMIEVSRKHAIDVLLDQQLFTLSPERYNAFVAALEKPPRANIALRAVMGKQPLWEK